jgi:uncharacterized protein
MHHGEAHAWFRKNRRRGFATCPLTQLGFIRLSSNSRFTKDAVSPLTAIALLDRIATLSEHTFWPDALPCIEALESDQLIAGHQQVTDFYLLGLARRNDGVLATFDRSVPRGGAFRKRVEMIGGQRI